MSGAIAQRANETSKALGGKVSFSGRARASSRAGRTARSASRSTTSSAPARCTTSSSRTAATFGGGMMICPEAEPDDGLFDVLMIGDLTKRDLLVDAAEDLPRQAPAAPEDRAAPRRGRSRSTRACRCRSSSTASSPGRRRPASRSCRARCASASLLTAKRAASSASPACAPPASCSRRRRVLPSAATCCSSARDPLLELLEPADPLLQLVEPRLRLVRHVDDAEPPGTSESFCSASSPRSWTRARMSFWDAFAMGSILCPRRGRLNPRSDDDRPLVCNYLFCRGRLNWREHRNPRRKQRGTKAANHPKVLHMLHPFGTCLVRASDYPEDEMAQRSSSSPSPPPSPAPRCGHARPSPARRDPVRGRAALCSDCRRVLDERTVRRAPPAQLESGFPLSMLRPAPAVRESVSGQQQSGEQRSGRLQVLDGGAGALRGDRRAGDRAPRVFRRLARGRARRVPGRARRRLPGDPGGGDRGAHDRGARPLPPGRPLRRPAPHLDALRRPARRALSLRVRDRAPRDGTPTRRRGVHRARDRRRATRRPTRVPAWFVEAVARAEA